MKPVFLDELVDLCAELSSQERKLLPLCAAENIMSPFCKIPLDSFLQEKYIMGGTITYQKDNNFIGSDKLYSIYNLLTAQCKKMYHSNYADARTLSGVNAVTSLLMSLFTAGDKILISSEACGGHGSMPKICNRLGIETEELPYDYDALDFDYIKANQIIQTQKPNGILICLSDIIRMPQLHKLNLSQGCILIFDATQILGLIATGKLDNPMDWYSENDNFILMGATHKTLAGPTCGLIMTKNISLAQKFDSLINPDYLRNSQLHHILSLILSLMELEVYGTEYAERIVSNANILADCLSTYGFDVIKADKLYTYTHQLFVSMTPEDAQFVYDACAQYGISLNLRNKPIYRNCGLRIGTQQISRFNWSASEMQTIAQILNGIYNNLLNPESLRDKINELSHNKKVYYTFDKSLYDIIYNTLHNR